MTAVQTERVRRKAREGDIQNTLLKLNCLRPLDSEHQTIGVEQEIIAGQMFVGLETACTRWE